MNTPIKAAVIAALVAGSAFADEVVTEGSAPPKAASTDHYIGISTGANLGLLQVDVMQDHFYAFASTTLGVPLLTNGDVAVGTLGLGYAFTLSDNGDSKWLFDVYGQGMGGRMNMTNYGGNAGFGGIGFGVGVRFLHKSGFMIAFKLPVFGAGFGDAASPNGSFNGSASLGTYYLGYLASSAPFTIGFRF
jgi:hypothetical protein